MRQQKTALNRIERQQAQYGLKKHFTQMTELEHEFLMRRFRAVRKIDWELTDYSLGRMRERGVTMEQLLTVFHEDSRLIEYHRRGNSNRILIRSSVNVNGSNVCAVFAPDQKTIITIYLNDVTNDHPALRKEFYDASIDILESYKGGKTYGQR